MKAQWESLEEWLEKHTGADLVGLNPPISDAELSALEEKVGTGLPKDFVDFMKVHNGQRVDAAGLIDGTELLSAERIIDEWSCWNELCETGAFEDFKSEPDPGVKPDWWNRGWIPFTFDGSGNHLCLDLSPAIGGRYGQIITMWHDDGQRHIVAACFSDWFHGYVQGVVDGKYIYSEEFGGVVRADEA